MKKFFLGYRVRDAPILLKNERFRMPVYHDDNIATSASFKRTWYQGTCS